MPLTARYVFTAAMDVQPDKEALFHEVYDREHVPSLLAVPGVISVARFQLEPLTMSIGGELKTIVVAGVSAGGYGTLNATATTRLRYPKADIFVYDDSGPWVQNLAQTGESG